MLASQETKITFKIPEERSELVFDKKYKNIRKIEENTGAKISDSTEATVNGTYDQCEVAKPRIEVYLDNEVKKPKPSVYPELGFTILDTSRAASISSRATPKIHFRRYDLEDINAHSRGKGLFYVMFKDLETKEVNYNELEKVIDDTDLLFEAVPGETRPSMWSTKRNSNYENDLGDANGILKDLDTNQLEWEPAVLAPTPQLPFSIFSQLSQCMAKITSRVSELFPVSDSGMEIRVSLYLGRELFFNVESPSYTLPEWCNLRRPGPKGIKTSFQHDVPVDGLTILQTDLGFQESLGDSEKDKWSITIYFNDSEEKKMKLNWDYQRRIWKVTKVVKSLCRIILMDLLSGSHLPDIRFLVKTQIRIPIDQKLVDLIKNLQNSVNRDERNIPFHVKDFTGILNVTRIVHNISKRRFYNKDYRISIVPTKYESNDTRVTYGNNVTIKHLDWIAMNKYQMQIYKNSLKKYTVKSYTSHLPSSPPLSILSRSSSSIHSSPLPTPCEHQESNPIDNITEEFDLISFDDEPPPTLLNVNIRNKTCHLLDDNSTGFNQVKHILDDDSVMKIKQHILDNDNELGNQKHILDDDYDSQTTYNNKYEYEKDEDFKNEELQNYEETGIEEEFVEEKNWKDILEFTLPNSIEYAREFCRIVS